MKEKAIMEPSMVNVRRNPDTQESFIVISGPTIFFIIALLAKACKSNIQLLIPLKTRHILK